MLQQSWQQCRQWRLPNTYEPLFSTVYTLPNFKCLGWNFQARCLPKGGICLEKLQQCCFCLHWLMRFRGKCVCPWWAEKIAPQAGKVHCARPRHFCVFLLLHIFGVCVFWDLPSLSVVKIQVGTSTIPVHFASPWKEAESTPRHSVENSENFLYFMDVTL